MTSVAPPTHPPQEQVPAIAPSQNTSSPVQVSNGPAVLTPEQVDLPETALKYTLNE